MYFNRIDRENHVLLMAVAQHIRAWLEKNKNLNAEEKKYIKMGCSFFEKAADSMTGRADKDYIRALKNQVAVTAVNVVQEYEKNAQYVDTVNVIKDDFLDLAKVATTKCKKCRCKNYKRCKKYMLFLKLNIPTVYHTEEENFSGCPYAE